jgi:hypothetical protein
LHYGIGGDSVGGALCIEVLHREKMEGYEGNRDSEVYD